MAQSKYYGGPKGPDLLSFDIDRYFDCLTDKGDVAKQIKSDIANEICYYFLNVMQKAFVWEGLPDTIPQESLEMILQANGFAIVTNKNGSLYALSSGLGGERDEYYFPKIATVANPYLNLDAALEIGKDCEIIKCDTYMRGLIPTISRYSALLTENFISMRLAEVNTRSTMIFSAPDDKTKKSAEVYQQKIANGQLGVIRTTPLNEAFGVTSGAIGSSDSLRELVEVDQYLKGSLFMWLGVESPYNLKREALNSAETSISSETLRPFIENMLSERKLGAERVNRLYGTSIRVRLSDLWAKHEDPEKEKQTEEKKDVSEKVK